MHYPHIIIGGGIYGCFVALRLSELYGSAGVVIIEKQPDIILRASYNNQARVHNGYHYPESSPLTALRSRVNAPRFLADFKDAIFTDFDQYYAISRRQSNVTSSQFEQVCHRVGASIKPAPASIKRLFNDDLIEEVYCVTEYAFDADKLRKCLRGRIAGQGIKILT